MMLNFWYHQQFEKSRVPIQPWHIHTAKLPVIHSVDQTICTNSNLSKYGFVEIGNILSNHAGDQINHSKKKRIIIQFFSVKGRNVFSHTLHIFLFFCQFWYRLFLASKFDISSVIKRNHRITAIANVCFQKLEKSFRK